MSGLIEAINSDNIQKVKEAVLGGASVNEITPEEASPLIIASTKGNIDIVRFLLESGANIHYKDKREHTALHFAVDLNHLEVVKLLLQNGADVNATNIREFTSLQYAAIRGHIEIVKLLIEKSADVNLADDDGNTSLMDTIMYDKPEVAELLIKNGADVNSQNKKGKTALHIAVEKQSLDMVKLLLENHADVTIKDRTGETPASIASSIPKFNEEVKGMLLALSTKEPPKNSNTKMSPAVFRTLKKGTPVNFSARDIECIVFNNLNEITIPFAYKPAENRKQIIDLILSEPEICTPLGQNYVKKSLQLSNIIVLYLINKDVLGFATVVPQRGTILYLDVICTNYRYRGVGHHLIQDVKSIAHKNDMKFVKLDSTGPSFPFYQHEGFDLNFSTLIPMTYNITKNKTNVSKERRYTRRNSKRSNKKRNL